MAEPLPNEVRRLIAGPVESMEHLELLLLLARTEPRSWSATEAAAELRLDPAFTEKRLRDLAGAGLASETRESEDAPRCFAFQLSGAFTRHDVSQLLDIYNTRPVTLVRAVYDRRTVVAQSFADAFRVRKESP